MVQIKQHNYWNLSLTSQRVHVFQNNYSQNNNDLQTNFARLNTRDTHSLNLMLFCQTTEHRHYTANSKPYVTRKLSVTFYCAQLMVQAVLLWDKTGTFTGGQRHQPVWSGVHQRTQILSQVLSALGRSPWKDLFSGHKSKIRIKLSI